MISFCHDLSISNQYHIYENKTIRKFSHKRISSNNLYQKTFVKTSKLSLVSKDKEQLDFSNQLHQLNRIQTDKIYAQTAKINENHKRSTSNYVEDRARISPHINMVPILFPKKVIKTLVVNSARSIQSHQQKVKPKVTFNQIQDNNISAQKNNSHKIVGQIFATQPINYLRQQRKVLFVKNQPQKITEIQQLRTIKYKQSLQKLNESIETKHYEQSYSKINHHRNHSQSNSFTSNKTTINHISLNTPSSLTSQSSSLEKQRSKRIQYGYLTPRQISSNNVFYDQKFVSPEKQYISLKQKESFNSPLLSQKIIIPKINLQYQTWPRSQTSLLYDTESVVSKDMEGQQDDEECTSVVEQRNFFFQKQESPEKAFKKSIDKFLFFEPGYISQNSKWVLFRNVKEKENDKIYSIKEFSTQHEKYYFNEYDIYLALKAQTSHFMSQTNGNNFFLNLYNALSNNEDKKLHLVKDSFDSILTDYINHLKNENSSTIEGRKRLIVSREQMQFEIEKIFQFFTLKGIQISPRQDLQIEDFVVCQSATGMKTIKFHSLQKLQKIQNEKNSFKRLKNEMQINSIQSSVFEEKIKKKKMDSFYRKMNFAFIFS